MKRAGLFFIAMAAAVTIACGGSDNEASSSPTGPSSSPSSNAGPQPSCTSPGAPSNLAVASVAGTVVTLTWSGVNGATEYLVLVGTTPSSSNTLLTNTSQPSYTWTVSPGSYYARIQSKNACGTSGSSNEVSFSVAG